MNRRSLFGHAIASLFAPSLVNTVTSKPTSGLGLVSPATNWLRADTLPEWASGPKSIYNLHHRMRGYACPNREMARCPNIEAIRSYSPYYRGLKQAEADLALDREERSLTKRIEAYAEKLGLRWDPYN